VSVPDQYIFGYGSLLLAKSRRHTRHGNDIAYPVIVQGVERGWFDHVDAPGYTTTYLGADLSAKQRCNGVIFKINCQELEAYDCRETGYTRVRIDQPSITMLDGRKEPPPGDVWVYVSTERAYPSPDNPIVQSYVDVCVKGCLEMEERYPLAREVGFADLFFTTTTGWSHYWENDRIFPRRPYCHERHAYTIDALIRKHLGDDLFERIPIAPGRWAEGER
jgi:cation transport regulator ChaC